MRFRAKIVPLVLAGVPVIGCDNTDASKAVAKTDTPGKTEKGDPKTETKAETKPAAKAEGKAEPEADAKPAAKAEAKTETKASAPKKSAAKPRTTKKDE